MGNTMAPFLLDSMTQLITPKYTFLGDTDVEAVQRTQEITSDFLQQCHDNRVASNQGSMGELHQFASIPCALVEHWMRQGFDIYQESAAAIMKRLRDEDLQAFITTDKRI